MKEGVIRIPRRTVRFALLLFVALAGLWLQLSPPGPLQRLSLPLEDVKFALRASLGLSPVPADEVVIVAIDERSVNRLGRWPWDRTVVAGLLQKMEQASIIGLDMVFSEATTPQADAALVEIFEQNGNLVAGFFFRREASERAGESELELLRESAYREVELASPTVGVKEFPFAELNIEPLAEVALAQAFFSTEPDPDGLYRRYPLAFVHGGDVYPPLAVQMLRYARNREARLVLDGKGVARFALDGVELAGENYLRLNYSDLAATPILSAVDVLEGRIPVGHFTGKLVLLGVTEQGVYDLRPTPVDPVTPGVWLHYTALSNFLFAATLCSSAIGDAALVLLAVLLVAAAALPRAQWKRIFGYLLVLVGVTATASLALLAGDLWLREFVPLLAALLCACALEAQALLQSEGEARQLRRAFSSYVEPRLVGEILRDPQQLALGGSEKELTVLFSDIRGFTALSERLEAQQLVQVLSRVHGPLTDVVLRRGGMLDKYIGDALMALFNVPLPLGGHAEKAVEAALEMVTALAAVNEQFAAEGLPQVAVGVGVNTGSCVVGNFGTRERFDYTAIGDPVNLAARLEGLCRTYGVPIIFSEYTRAQIMGDLLTRKLDRVRVKGKEEPVTIYEALAGTDANRQLVREYEAALDLYFAGRFTAAGKAFASLAEHDPASKLFVDRCALYGQMPPDGWDGVYTLTTK